MKEKTGTRQAYRAVDVDENVRFYTSGPLKKAQYLEGESFAQARSALPTWCLDGLVCGKTESGKNAVILLVRSDSGVSDGPFRNEPWVIGGKWDMVTPWKEFVRRKAAAELYGLSDVDASVSGPIGNQLFATGFGPETDGPFGLHGITVQFCFHVVLNLPLDKETIKATGNHCGFLILTADEPLPDLHPYVRDVIELSGWLAER